MNEFGILLIIPFYIILALLIRLVFIAGMDKSLVRREVERCGHRVIDVSWNHFGPGWYTENGERGYSVIYTTSDGSVIFANCKTSMITGIFRKNGSPDIDIMENSIICANCKYAISGSGKICSKCGNAIA